MSKNNLPLTNIAKIAQQKRMLALKQQDSAVLTGLSLADDDSHLDLTTRIRFLEATGGPPPFVLERIDASGNVDRYTFERPFLLVGRSAACDVVCRLRSLSFRHLYLQYLNGTVWWFDLDSRSGVSYQGAKRQAGCLLPGMSLQVGEYTLRLVEPGSRATESQNRQAPSPTTLTLAKPANLPQVALEFENGKIGRDANQFWPIENSITLLGRRSCCDIRFADECVSRVHASLVLTSEGLWVVDLLGREGTQVNGVTSAYAYLQDGSLLQLGGYKMRVRYQTESFQPHPAEAILDNESAPRRNRRRAQGGTVSEDLLYELVTNMAEMQKQMFDQSQMQIGLLVQMLGSIHQSQQDMLRNELNRVHEISREMHELQLRVTAQETAGQGLAGPPPATSSQAAPPTPPLESPQPDEDNGTEGDTDDCLPPPSLFEQDKPDPDGEVPPEDTRRPNSNEINEHAVLFQRMQNLDRERNSRLQKIFRAFRGSDS